MYLQLENGNPFPLDLPSWYLLVRWLEPHDARERRRAACVRHLNHRVFGTAEEDFSAITLRVRTRAVHQCGLCAPMCRIAPDETPARLGLVEIAEV